MAGRHIPGRAGLAALLMAGLLLAAGAAQAAGFREGDWLIYKMKVTAKSPALAAQLGTDHVSAEAEIKVTIDRVEGDTFTITYHVLSVKAEPQNATQLAQNLRRLDGTTKQYRLDQGFNDQEIPLYVSPSKLSNGGRYAGSQGAVSYEVVYDTKTGWLKHSLVKAEVMGTTLQAEMQLVRTSFGGGAGTSTLLVAAGIAAAAVAAAAAIALKLRRSTA